MVKQAKLWQVFVRHTIEQSDGRDYIWYEHRVITTIGNSNLIVTDMRTCDMGYEGWATPEFFMEHIGKKLDEVFVPFEREVMVEDITDKLNKNGVVDLRELD